MAGADHHVSRLAESAAVGLRMVGMGAEKKQWVRTGSCLVTWETRGRKKG